MKNSIPSNRLADVKTANLSPVCRTASHCMRAKPSHSRRRWGLHLVRRNGIFQFRRRWPTALTKIGAPAFLSVSLRTDVLSDAVKRSALLLTIIEAGERET